MLDESGRKCVRGTPQFQRSRRITSARGSSRFAIGIRSRETRRDARASERASERAIIILCIIYVIPRAEYNVGLRIKMHCLCK